MPTNYLSPVFNEQTFDASGNPLVGGQIETYVAGTSTPLATYTTQSGTTQQANPIILNARGEPANPIWLGAGQLYKFILKDSGGTLIRTIDNIGGVNDTSISVSEWVSSGFTPTYISTVSFSVQGDKTTDFAAGRRVRSTNSGGTVYSTVATSSYSSGTGLTTVTVRNDSGTLDAGLSSVDVGILTPVNPSVPNSQAVRQAMGLGWGTDIASAATLDLTARTGNIVRITGTTTTTAVTLSKGDQVWCYAVAAWPLTYNVTTMPIPGGSSYTCSAGDVVRFTKDGSGVITVEIYKKDGTPFAVASATSANAARVALTQMPTVRQTVLNGPIDSSGNASFGGSTGSTTVTASGTLTVTAANGVSGDYIGSITNPSWTGLSTNGTMYLYLDIAASGSCTTGSTTLAPVYQQGGTYSTTNGQFTFNIQEMTGKVGNGSSAVQTYRVFVGEVTVAGGVVTAITWYALMGRAIAQTANINVSTAFNLTHNIGLVPQDVQLRLVCLSAEANWGTGDEIVQPNNFNDGVSNRMFTSGGSTRTSWAVSTGGTALALINRTTFGVAPLTTANWAFKLYFRRGW